MTKKNGKLKQPGPKINTQQDVLVLHQQQENSRREEYQQRRLQNLQTNLNSIRRLPPTTNADPIVDGLARANMLRLMLDGARDIDAECGYPTWLTAWHYQQMYDREGIARRVVHCEPEESWIMDPEVYEDNDPENETEFEQAWAQFLRDYDGWHHLQRIDVLSGIGQFGILLIGIDDGEELDQPVEGLQEDGSWEPPSTSDRKVLYLRPFSEEVVMIRSRERDPSNPRYGMPTLYGIQFRDYPNWGLQVGENVSATVHWSRVIHVADNRKMSDVFGTPRMQDVWNRLYDLRKAYSASGEALWKGAFPGYSFEVNPELADKNIEFDKNAIRLEMERFSNSLQRYIATQGLTVKSLGPNFSDPSNSIETILKAIAISKAIPYRILFGTEEARLAGSSDTRAWNARIARRQRKYVTPMIIRPFVDRLIAMGVLPRPEQYDIDWPDLGSPTDQDQATIAATRTQAISTYIQGDVAQLIGPMAFLTSVIGMDREEAEAAMQESAELQEYNEEQQQEQSGAELGEEGEGEEEEQPQEEANDEPPFDQRPTQNEFDESEHPRDEDGKWTSGGGGSSSAEDSKTHRSEKTGKDIPRGFLGDVVVGRLKDEGYLVTADEEEVLTGMTKLYANANPKATVEEVYDAVGQMYEYGQDSHRMNGTLRKGERPDGYAPLKKMFSSLPSAKSPPPPHYRGAALPNDVVEQLKPGAVIQDRAFLSTSKSRNVANSFLRNTPPGGHRRVLFEIEDGGGLGKEFGRGFMVSDEKEVVYPNGTNLLVEEVKEVEGEILSGQPYFHVKVRVA